MRTITNVAIALLFCIPLFAQTKSTGTKPKNTANASAKSAAKPSAADLQKKFDRFFLLSDGDTADITLKSQLAMEICKADANSKYCTYVAAWASMYDEKYDHSLKLINELKSDYPEWPEVFYLHAQFLDYTDAPGAIEQAQQALELNPKLVPVVFFLATRYEEAENYKLSLHYYNELEKLAPGHRSVYYNRANVKKLLKDMQGAIADYTKVLQKDPKHYRALYNRAEIYLVLENYVKAEADLDAFMKLVNDYPSAYYNRGYARYKLNKVAGCCEDMKKAGQLGHKDAAEYAAANCN